MFRRTLLRVRAILALTLLAACGGASGPAASAPPASPSPEVAARATGAPAPAAAAATPAGATAQAVLPTAPIQQTLSTDSGGAAADARGIPEGTTAEGYHVLGRADAPVTLIMYSDFL